MHCIWDFELLEVFDAFMTRIIQTLVSAFGIALLL